jgi:hypothetical protein
MHPTEDGFSSAIWHGVMHTPSRQVSRPVQAEAGIHPVPLELQTSRVTVPVHWIIPGMQIWSRQRSLSHT